MVDVSETARGDRENWNELMLSADEPNPTHRGSAHHLVYKFLMLQPL
jgi:hypothetical protein